MSPPQAKKPRESTSHATGGFTILHQETIHWTLKNFKDIFLSTRMDLTNKHLLEQLQQEHLEFVVDALENFPMTEWKVSLSSDIVFDEESSGSEGCGCSSCECVHNRRIFIKYDLLTPNKCHVEGLYVRVQVEVMRNHRIVRTYDSVIAEASGTGTLLTSTVGKLELCSLYDHRDVFKVQSDGSLVFCLKFFFYSSNSRKPNLFTDFKDQLMKDQLRKNASEDFKKFLANEGADEVIVVASNGEKFVTNKTILKARSSYFKAMFANGWNEVNDHSIAAQFSPEVVSWMLDFVKTGEVKPFVLKKIEVKKEPNDPNEPKKKAKARKGKDDIPCLFDILQLAEYYNFRDLREYLECKMPTFCHDNPDLAPYLNQLAVKFSLYKAGKEIQKFILRRSQLVSKIIDEYACEED